MNAQIIMFGVVTVLGALLTFLQLWLVLLNDSGVQPLWILIGLMITIGGLLNIFRIRKEQREQG